MNRRRALRALRRDLGVSRPAHPRFRGTLRARRALREWGPTAAGAYAANAALNPDGVAVIDERGEVTFKEIHERTDRLAHALAARGVTDRDTIAIICANNRGFIEASVAAGKLAANVAYIRPDTPAPRLARALRESDAAIVICEQHVARSIAAPGVRLIATSATEHPGGCESLQALIDGAPDGPPTPPASRYTPTLTLADTAPAKRPSRRLPATLQTPGALASRIPLRRRQSTVIAAPLCETWGYLHLTLGVRLGSTLVLPANPDAIEVLASVERHRASALAVLPETLTDILALPAQTVRWYSTATLRVIAVRSRLLAGEIALPAIEQFGDVLFSLVGPVVIQLGDGWHPSATAAVTAGPARALVADRSEITRAAV